MEKYIFKEYNRPTFQIASSLARDSRLTWNDRGIMLYALSMAPDYKIHQTELIKASPQSEKTVRKSVNHLEELGYIQKVTPRAKNGMYDRRAASLIFYENPRLNVSWSMKHGQKPVTPALDIDEKELPY